MSSALIKNSSQWLPSRRSGISLAIGRSKFIWALAIVIKPTKLQSLHVFWIKKTGDTRTTAFWRELRKSVVEVRFCPRRPQFRALCIDAFVQQNEALRSDWLVPRSVPDQSLLQATSGQATKTQRRLRVADTITIRYDTVYLRALKSWWEGQFNISPGTETKIRKK